MIVAQLTQILPRERPGLGSSCAQEGNHCAVPLVVVSLSLSLFLSFFLSAYLDLVEAFLGSHGSCQRTEESSRSEKHADAFRDVVVLNL